MASKVGGRGRAVVSFTEESFHADALSDDLLSHVLSAVKVNSTALYVFDLSGPWAFELESAPFYISWTVVEGSVWLMNVEEEPVCFVKGDTFLLLGTEGPRPVIFGSAPDIKPVSIANLWLEAQKQGWTLGNAGRSAQHVRWAGEGPTTRVVSVAFSFNDFGLSHFLSALPQLIVLRSSENHGAGTYIDGLLRIALDSDSAALPGYSAIATQTAQLLLMLAVRSYALSVDEGRLGGLTGLGDPQIARALRCIHEQPDFGWTVGSLARAAGMSRSLFAERFVAQVGQTPKQYLLKWRMHLAREALAGGKVTVTALARNLGYRSETAFRAAFRRVIGCTPRDVLRHVGTKSL